MQSEEQQSMARQIHMRRKNKNLYDILDVTTASTPEQIKKSYKKLALKFHPDKNKAEDAKLLFSQITEAYATLSNESKKANYDAIQYRQNSKKTNSFQKNNSQKEYFQNSQYYENYVFYEQMQKQFRRKKKMEQQMKEKEQLKRRFEQTFQKFAQSVNNRQKKARDQKTNQMKRKYQQEKQKQRRNKHQQIKKDKSRGFLIVFAMFFLYFALGPILNAFQSTPIYSTRKTNIHTHRMQSSNFNQPYFVNNQYFTADTTDKQKQSINELVNRKYIINLKKQCKENQKNKESLENKARKQQSTKSRQKLIKNAQTIDLSACEDLFDLTEEHGEYLKTLKA